MLVFALALAAPLQTTWYVDAGGTAPGSGTAADPFTRVDFAVAQPTTVAGDTVLVRPGTYLDEVIDFAGKDLIVRSVSGPQQTVLEALAAPTSSAPIVRFVSGESLAATLDGFTLAAQGGDWTNTFAGQGGAIFCQSSAATLRNLAIRPSARSPQTAAAEGAGVYVNGGTLDITACVFEDLGENITSNYGAGLFANQSGVQLAGCTFRRCIADFGAGVYARDSLVTALSSIFDDSTVDGAGGGVGGAMALSNTRLYMNGCQVTNQRPGYEGAGLHGTNGTVLEILDSLFEGNRSGVDAYMGAGVYMDQSSRALILRGTFRDNRGQFGAAIYGEASIRDSVFENNAASGNGFVGSGGGAIAGSGTVTGSIFTGNSASDAYTDGGGAILGEWIVDRCTFKDNTAVSGTSGPVPSTAAGPVHMRNSIVLGGTAPRLDPAEATAAYSNVEGGFPGQGNFDLPESLWPDLDLLPDSPSIDSGDPLSPTDPDGTRVDRGARPFDPFHCGAGCFGQLGMTTCGGNINSTGLGADLFALGDATASQDRLVLNVLGSPPGSLGYFLASETAGNQPLGGGSQGTLCLGGNVLRFSNTVLDDRGVDVVSFRPRLGDFPQGDAVMAGDTWLFQYWFRDANPQSTSNTSAAVSITFQ